MTGRGTANLLTRSTAVLATLFMVLAMALALINRGASQSGGSSILNNPPPAAGAPATPVVRPPHLPRPRRLAHPRPCRPCPRLRPGLPSRTTDGPCIDPRTVQHPRGFDPRMALPRAVRVAGHPRKGL